jgi:hypothetical protein
MQPVKIGAILGAAIPAATGAFVLVSFWSQPELPPGFAYCGMPVLGAWGLIFFGTPLGALTGAAVGTLWSLVYETFRRSSP